MNKLGKDVNHTKNKVVGEVKEAAGKITGSEKLEAKGKMQSSKADLNKKKVVAIDKPKTAVKKQK